MMKTGLLVLLATLLVVVSAVPNGADNPLDPNCFCVYDWRGPNGYYNYWVNSDIVLATYHDADHWTPDPSLAIVPCKVCFVNILGRAVTFIDQFTDVNEMQIGGNEWDDAIVVVGGPGRLPNNPNVDLRIFYDFTPVIYTVTGERLANGNTLLTIVGKGFGFHASDLSIVAFNNNQDIPDADCYPLNPSDQAQYPYQINCPGRPSVLKYPPTSLVSRTTYQCTNIRIYYRDSHISCTVAIPDFVAFELAVSVTTPNGLTATQSLLSEFVQ